MSARDVEDCPHLELYAKPGCEESIAAPIRRIIAASGAGDVIRVEVEPCVVRFIALTQGAEEWLQGLAAWLSEQGMRIDWHTPIVGEA